MKLSEAQAILREHGLEDFPRPWIFETAKVLTGSVDVVQKDFWGWINWGEKFGGNYDSQCHIARETAILMGWTPANADARPADWKAE